MNALKERVVFPHGFWQDGKYFFIRPDSYDDKVVSKKWNTEAVLILEHFAAAIQEVETVSAENAKETLMEVLEKEGVGMGKVMQALRVALTGEGAGPDLMDTMEILGKKEITERIAIALNKLSDQVKN